MRDVGGFWGRRAAPKSAFVDGVDKDALLKTTLRELVVYVVFLVVLCLVAFLVVSSSQFYFTKVIWSTHFFPALGSKLKRLHSERLGLE